VRFSILHILLVFSLFISSSVSAQNLDKIGKEDMVTVSGGFNLNTITYASSGTNYAGRDPFTWFASGNITVNILDVSLPFSYTYSNRIGKFTQPYNQTALHPKYKWIQGHFGVTSMSFSPYTLAGHIFTGGGVDLTPGKWKISIMSGRLNKAVAYDPILDNTNNITYKRFGYGLKVGFHEQKYSVDLTLFKAKDDVNSLNHLPINTEVSPEDNVVMSLAGKTTLIKNLTLEGEYAISGLTQSTIDLNDYQASHSMSFINPLIGANSTTDYFEAYKASLSYKLKTASVAFNFEHVDPGYKTLGGYFFNNDLENYTLAPSLSLLKGRLNLAANTGFQRNNLAADKASTTNRWIGSLNVNYVPLQKLAIVGSYSNFSTFTRNRPTTDPFYYQAADTLNFYQLSQNTSAGVTFQTGKKDKDLSGTIQALYNFQESESMSGNIQNASAFGMNVGVEGVPSYVHAGNLSYSARSKKMKVGVTLATNVNQVEVMDQKTLFIGPTIKFQKKIKDNFNLSGGSTYNRQYKNALLSNNVFNHRISLSHTVKMKNEKQGRMNLSLNGNWMQKLPTVSSETKMSELNIFANLNYSF